MLDLNPALVVRSIGVMTPTEQRLTVPAMIKAIDVHFQYEAVQVAVGSSHCQGHDSAEQVCDCQQEVAATALWS